MPNLPDDELSDLMTARNRAALERFKEKTCQRSDKKFFFGNSGMGRVEYKSARREIELDPLADLLTILGLNQGPQLVLAENFLQLPKTAASVGIAASPNFAISGTNAVDGSSAYDPEGGCKLTTGALQNDQVILEPHTNSEQSGWRGYTWGTGEKVAYRAMIKTGPSIASCILWAGLKLTSDPAQAADDHQVYIRYQDTVNGGRWQALWSIAGVDSSKDSAEAGLPPVAVDTVYHLVITIDAERVSRVYINGVLVATTAALTAAQNLIPFVGIQTTAAGAKSLTVRHCGISKDYA